MAMMLGRAAAGREAYERVLFGAWQNERFAREEKLRPFAYYRKQLKRKPAPQRAARQSPMERLAVFQELAAGGVPMKIERVSRTAPR